MKRIKLLLMFAFLASPLFLSAQDEVEDLPGIMGEEAPKFNIGKWHQLPEGKDDLEITDFRGKTLVMLLFQYSTPNAHEEAFPMLKRLVEHFQGNDEIAFLAIQAVGTNRNENTSDKMQAMAEKFELDIPFGHYVMVPEFPGIVGGYKPEASPWWVVIDRKGKVEWNGPALNDDEAIENLEQMIAGIPVD